MAQTVRAAELDDYEWVPGVCQGCGMDTMVWVQDSFCWYCAELRRERQLHPIPKPEPEPVAQHSLTANGKTARRISGTYVALGMRLVGLWLILTGNIVFGAALFTFSILVSVL